MWRGNMHIMIVTKKLHMHSTASSSFCFCVSSYAR